MGSRVGRRLFGLTTAALTAGAVAVGSPAAAAPAEGTILGAGTADVVAGSYIVKLKTTNRATVDAQSQSLAGRYGGTVARTYTHVLKGFAVNLDEAAARKLAADPAVDYVQQDSVMSVSGEQSNPPSWGLDRIDQRDLPLDQSYSYPDVTQNVRAYVLDTGILTSHNDFGGRAVQGRDAVDNDNDATDCHGHGTHVAGTIGGSSYGVAKTATLVAVRVLNCGGSGSVTGIVAGIDWATADRNGRPAVANMSLGGGVNTALDNAVADSIAAGMQYSLAAGNSNASACTFSPARTPNAITVGATQNNDARASFSNYGNCLDLFAPGVNITSAWYSSPTATNTISGTSMAAPHVAGAAALVLAAHPDYSPQQVRDAVVDAATPDKVTNPMSGSPNKLLFTGEGDDPGEPGGCTATNGDDVDVPDESEASSTIEISGCGRTASATATVEVHVVHTYRGDLWIDLIAPDGTEYGLKGYDGGDGADNVDETYTVDLSDENADGTWTLRVRDVFAIDTGHIDSWTLTV